MTKNVFSFSRLRAGDYVILGNCWTAKNEIRVIHARVIAIDASGIHVHQTINNPDSSQHAARWLGLGRVDGDNAQLSLELELDDARGDVVPQGHFLVFSMDSRPYVLSFTSIEVNREERVVQDLTQL
jgi:hypothetical protein